MSLRHAPQEVVILYNCRVLLKWQGSKFKVQLIICELKWLTVHAYLSEYGQLKFPIQPTYVHAWGCIFHIRPITPTLNPPQISKWLEMAHYCDGGVGGWRGRQCPGPPKATEITHPGQPAGQRGIKS